MGHIFWLIVGQFDNPRPKRHLPTPSESFVAATAVGRRCRGGGDEGLRGSRQQTPNLAKQAFPEALAAT